MENPQSHSSAIDNASIMPLLLQFNTALEHSYQQQNEQLEDDRCLQIQINQLKRENNFLKKKIAELVRESNLKDKKQFKRQCLPSNFKPPTKLHEQHSPHYIISFLEEVTKLLESFSQLFKLNIRCCHFNNLSSQQEVFHKLTEQKDMDLNRQLSKLLLQAEQRRFGSLLQILESYYRQNKQRSRTLQQKTQSLTLQLIQAAKNMTNCLRSSSRLKGSALRNPKEHTERHNQDRTMKESFIKSTCTDSQLDLSSVRFLMSKDKHQLTPF